MAVTSVTAIVTQFTVDNNTPANNNTFYVSFFVNDGSYSSSTSVNADITQTSQQVAAAIATAVANAVNTALGTALTSSNVLLVNRPSDGTGTISSGTIASGSIGKAQIASGGLTSGSIASGTIDSAFLASGAVQSGDVGNNAVVSGTVASGQISTFHLSSGSVNSGQIGNTSVVSGSIASGQIGTNHFSSGQIVQNALASGLNAAITYLPNTASQAAETISGNVAVCLVDGAGGGQARYKVAMAAVSGRMPAIGIAVTNALSGGNPTVQSLGDFNMASGMLLLSGTAFGGVRPMGLPLYVGRSGQISVLSGATLSGGFQSGDIIQRVGFVGDPEQQGLGITTIRIQMDTSTKDATFSPPGTFWVLSGDISSGQIGHGHIASGAVASGQIGSGSIGGQAGAVINIASGTIRHFDFGSGAIQSGDIASGQIGGSLIASGGVTSGAIASGQVGSFALASGSVVSGRIASGTVGQFSMSSGAIVSGDIGNNAVVSGSIASGQLGQFSLSSGAVNSGQIGNQAVAGTLGNIGNTPNIVSGSIGANDLASGGVKSGHLNSGAIITYTRNILCDTYTATETISGVRCVRIQASGFVQIAMAAVSGRMPSDGIAFTNTLSGSVVAFMERGTSLGVASEMGSGFCVSGRQGSNIYVGSSGQVVTISGGGPTVGVGAGNSGAIGQLVGRVIHSGQVAVYIDRRQFSGAALITTDSQFWPL